jgi:hypothetical protein
VHTQEINEYPEDAKAEFLRVSEWIRKARKQYGNRILIRLVDPQSVGGMWKVLRHRIRRYPTFFVDRAERVIGWEADPDSVVARAVARHAQG